MWRSKKAGPIDQYDGSHSAETIADQQNAAVASLVADSAWVVVAFLAAVVVLKMSNRYERRRMQVLEDRAEQAAEASLRLTQVPIG